MLYWGIRALPSRICGKTHTCRCTIMQLYHHAVVCSPKWLAGRSKWALKSQGSWGGQAGRRPRVLAAGRKSRQPTPPSSSRQSKQNHFPHLPPTFDVSSLHKMFKLLGTSIPSSMCCLMLKGVAFPGCIRCLVLLLAMFSFFTAALLLCYLLALKDILQRPVLDYQWVAYTLETRFHPQVIFSRPLLLSHI